MKRIGLILVLLCLIPFNKSWSQTIVFDREAGLIGDKVELYEDSTRTFTYEEVKNKKQFKKSNVQTPNFNLSNSTFWIRFKLKNNSAASPLMLMVDYPLLDQCELYWEDSNGTHSNKLSDSQPFSTRNFDHQNPIFNLNLLPQDTQTYYLKASGSEQVILPILISSPQDLAESSLRKDILNGLQMGILLVMMLYNLFVFVSIRDRSYLYYVFYILFIGLTQATLSGYSIKYLWPNNPQLTDQFVILFPALAGIFAIQFIKDFLHTKTKVPILHKGIQFVLLPYALAPIFRAAGFDMVSYRLIDISGLSGGIITLIISAKLAWKGYRPAQFFFSAWVIFILGLILYILRNLDIVPYNIFTNNSMQLGTAIEVTLLSLALADKINTLKKEKEESQLQALKASEENEKIVREQNIVLEIKVQERTLALSETNQELNQTLNKLKDTQSKLVEAEKMSSLGQLTAGIAHEINNPINFITSNIRPLHRDIKDIVNILDEYSKINPEEAVAPQLEKIELLKKKIDSDYVKKEMDMLVDAISDGANRTSAIVKGLRSFSRLDELDLRYADIHEGIDSTLLLLKNKIKDRIEIVKNYAEIPQIECYIGKLNQVFMNILTNSLHALDPILSQKKGIITIHTMLVPEGIQISFKDNGNGMSDEIKNRIFEPFFTTKGVGEGTGLGLSIVYTIIETHRGTIEVDTLEGVGSEFKITIPLKQ